MPSDLKNMQHILILTKLNFTLSLRIFLICQVCLNTNNINNNNNSKNKDVLKLLMGYAAKNYGATDCYEENLFYIPLM